MNRIEFGDCREIMRRWIAQGVKVQTCVTSPPYFGLRDYGVDSQIGLEASLPEYIAAMVEVFSLVRELLADDGTLWLNMGDSYANDGKWGGSSGGKHASALHGKTNIGRGKVQTGLKPKDLMMVPARLALALQQPRYTGSVKDERDRVWLAAMLDAEGCMFIHKRKAGQSNGQGYFRQNDTYSPGIEICNTSLAVIERISAIVGKGSICSQGPEENGRRRQTIYRWNLRTSECRELVRELYPYLIAKQQQARILLGCPSSGERAEAAHAALIGLHRGSPTDVDFPEPLSCFVPGWFLRQDLIWSKPNPMPESTRDRCTKAHEYVFLLAKSERYYFDQDAIKEPCSDNTHARYAANGGSEPSPYGWATGGGKHTAVAHQTADTHRKARLPGNKSHKGTAAYEAGDERQRTKAGLLNYARKLEAASSGTKNNESFDKAMAVMPAHRNKRSVWTVASEPYSGAHFATFPTALIRPCILAGARPGDIVFDPFMGSGTTAQVAADLGRRYLGCELNPGYGALQDDRIRQRGLALA